MSADNLLRLLRRFQAVSLLTEIMHGLVVFSVILIPVRALAPAQTLLLLSWMIAAYLLLWIARHLLNHIWQFLVLGVLLSAMPLLPLWRLDLIPVLFLMPTMLFMTVRSFIIRLNQDKEQATGLLGSQALALIFLLVLNLVAVRLDLPEISQAYFYLAIIYLLLAIFRWHKVSLDAQMSRFDVMPTQPARRIRRFSQMLLLAFSALILVVLLISPFLHLHDLLPWLGSLALVMLRWLLSLLRADSEPEPTEPQPQPTETEPNGPLPFEPGETAVWWLIIQEIMYYLFLIISTLALLALIVYVLYRIYRRFYEIQPGADVAESLLPRWTEDVRERVKAARFRWQDQFGQSPEQKIRRLYHKTTYRLRQNGLIARPQFSPRKFADWLLKNRDIDILAMTYIYEKARYGPGQCTDNDVGQMQDLYRAFRKFRIRPKGKEESK